MARKYKLGIGFWVLAFGFILKHMLIMIGSKNTKLLEDFKYMQFQKTHKCETLISDGRIHIPTTGACAFGSGAQKCLSQSEVGRSSLFSYLSAWKTQTGVRTWCTCFRSVLISCFLWSFVAFLVHEYKWRIFSS